MVVSSQDDLKNLKPSVIKVTEEEWERIHDLITNPPEPTEDLKKSFELYKSERTLGDNNHEK